MDSQEVRGLDDVSMIKASGDGVINTSSHLGKNEECLGLGSTVSQDDARMHKSNGKGRRAGTESEGDSDEQEKGDIETRKGSSVNASKVDLEVMKKSSGYPFNAVQTQTKSCCDKEGHICFDCFPIPDALLDQLRSQTGMSKLACLQTVQTVVKFYKQDLVCSKYFASETTDDAYSDYSHTEDGIDVDDSAVLFRATPTPVRRQERRFQREEMKEQKQLKSKPFMHQSEKMLSPESEYEFGPSPTWQQPLKLCGADKFRHLVRRLKLEAGSKSWNNPKNESFVFTLFRKLNKVVAILDKTVLKRLIVEDDFEFLWILANSLPKENRWSIQWEVLGILGTVASRDSRSRKLLLDSDFPVYLSRILLNSGTESQKLWSFAELLTVLFTGGKPLPIYQLENFGVDFVTSILDIVENDETHPGWNLPEVLVKLLLAYNLQFSQTDVYNNITILGIARMGPCKTLTNRLIDWLDQKDSSLTNSWEVSVSIHQCVIKMISDIFLCRTTSHVFSVSQSVRIMRMLTRGLSDFLAGDKRRTSYLKLIQTILRHCKYDYIRNTPCLQCLEEILCEKSELSLHDQGLIRSIFKEFPQLHQ